MLFRIRSSSQEDLKRDTKYLEKQTFKLERIRSEHTETVDGQNSGKSSDNTIILGKRSRKLERTRKRPEQMDILRRVFKENKGKMPPRGQRLQLAE